MSAVDPAETFRQEAQDLLEQLEQALLDLEHAPESADLIDTAFRALHTIKGSGAMFGFDRLAAFTHHVETAFDLVRKGKVTAGHELIAVTLSARDHMRKLIETPDDADDSDDEAILARLRVLVDEPEAENGAEAAAPEFVPQAEGEESLWHIHFRLPHDAMTMGTNPLLLLAELRSMGEATVVPETDAIPSIEDMRATGCYVGDEHEHLIEPLTPEASADAGEAAQEPVEDVPAPQAEEPPLAAAKADKAAAKPPSGAAKPEPGAAKGRAAKTAEAIRVPAERLDALMDRVGELVIAQSRLKQVAADSEDIQVKSISEEIERLALELRDTTMGVRMVPFGSLFGRFRRLVHDLSRDLGKDIEFLTIGEDTELDKTVIERLGDPLIHLVRNAIDHGLEDKAGRANAGKPAQGQISLSARHAGAEVLISVRDDGRGLDRERIQARAEETGLIAPGATLTDAELFPLIFQPGFSTAAEVTSLSGRGVGMDVVKRTIDALRGNIDVSSTLGEGTEVTLRLPLTLAIIDGLLVRVGNGRYVIPLSAVEECVELPLGEDARTRGRSFLNIRDELVPYLRLRDMFHSAQPADEHQKVVIVSSGELRVGLVVDQVIGDHQTVIKSLSRLHADVKTFSGATILGDGTVALILEVPHLVEFGQAEEGRLQAAG